jgi:hypothetical protein
MAHRASVLVAELAADVDPFVENERRWRRGSSLFWEFQIT